MTEYKYRYKVVGIGPSNYGVVSEYFTDIKRQIGETVMASDMFWFIDEEIK